MMILSNSIFLPNGMEAVQADYKEFPLEEFNQNPLIQALPPLLDKAAIIRKLMVKPIYNDEEKHAESIYRIHMINRLFQLYTPLPVHIDVWNMVHTLILQGTWLGTLLIRTTKSISMTLEKKLSIVPMK